MSTSSNAPTEPLVRYLESPIEHSLIFGRPDGDQVNMCVDHFGSNHSLTLAVFDMLDPEQPELKEQLIFSYQEARLLRDLLNRPEISVILEREV